jgi:two-component system OmpR family sensor kinase
MSAPDRPWSLRGRLTGRVLALVMGAWVVTVALSARVLDHEMNEMFDEELSALVETTVLYLDTAQTGAIPRTLGIETNDGERVLRILAPDRADVAAPWAALDRDGYHDAPGWRILRRSAEGVVIEAAHATTWRREEMLEAALAFLVLALPLFGLLLWGLRRMVAEATAPVARLADRVAARGPDDLSPMAATALPDEVQPLAQALNGYLARIAALRRSERDFIANVAHELRTPLAALRHRLQLSPDADAQAAVQTVDGLTRRVERLLHLSRLDAGIGLGRGPADLILVLRLLIAELALRARHPLLFDDGDLESFEVAADPDALAILLRNLIENAAEHGSGAVRITLSGGGQLRIENPADQPRLPEGRFAPGPGSAGSGLGLSIAAAMAGALEVPMTLSTGVDRVCVTLDFAQAAARPGGGASGHAPPD